jgi:ribosomal-protein-alanine N-acetyltransferase
VTLRAATAADLTSLVEVHAACFDAPWDAADLALFLADRSCFALAADIDSGDVAGFILCRAIAGEAEVLTLAVRPERRRAGVGAALVAAALALAATRADAIFLEVGADNPGAHALYERAGFMPVGRRTGYYARLGAPASDAIVMRRALNT